MADATGAAPAPAPDYAALREEILRRRNTLPKRLKQVAAFALDNPDAVTFGTVATIAAASEVPPSTLIRFSQEFGFEGFSSLQQVFRDRFRERTADYAARLEALPHDDALAPFLAAARASLDRAAASVRPDAFAAAVATLAAAELVYLVAARRAYPVAAAMAYSFGTLGVPYVLLGSAADIDDGVVAVARPTAAALAVSYAPYAARTVSTARGLHARGVPVVAITDSALSPLTEIAAVWLEVAEAATAGFRSLSASLALAQALAAATAEERRTRTK